MIFDTEFEGGVAFGAHVRGRDLPWPEYERLDGRTKVRADNLRLSAKYPIGKLTGTIRTLAASPTANPVIATANHFVAAGASTANAVQFSSDGASWATSATGGAVAVSALIQTPTRLIALSSTAQPAIASNGLTPAATWANTASSPQSVTAGSSMCRGCYHAAGARVVAVQPSTGIFTLDDGSNTWATRTSSARQGVASTGSRLIGITAGTATASMSLDNGVTWADFTLLEALSASQGNIASNGAGLIGISGSPSGLQVSLDNGDTWRIVQIPGLQPSDAWRIQFAPASGGSPACFMMPTVKGLAMSLDLQNWQIDPTQVQTLATAVGVAKKGSTIVQIPGGSTTAYSLLESSTEYRLPDVQEFSPSVSGVPTPLDPTFIKAL